MFRRLLPTKPAVFGMIHVDPSPSAPLFLKRAKNQTTHFQNQSTIDQSIEKSIKEARVYVKNGLHGLVVENMWDIPYVKTAGPEVVAYLTRICSEIRREFQNVPIGLQVLAGCNEEPIAIAQACDLCFIRAEGFVFAHVADEGLMQACAGQLLRYRRRIGADHIAIIADIKKKHSSHSITADLTVTETAKAAEFFLADGIVLTGQSTGDPANKFDLDAASSSIHIPCVIGSGLTTSNMDQYATADAWIVGSFFKTGGDWRHGVDAGRVEGFMRRYRDVFGDNG